MNYFLVKSEPETYSWSQLIKDGKTMWEGVRNYAARIHLRAMKNGDLVLFYHSGEEKSVMGITKVVKEAYPDPTQEDLPAETSAQARLPSGQAGWSVVDLAAEKPLKKPVTLSAIKAEKKLQNIYLVRQGRLSVMPLGNEEFELIVKMGS